MPQLRNTHTTLMSKILLLGLAFWFFVASLCAQTPDSVKWALTTTTKSYNMSSVIINDPYLSPLKYSGITLGYTTDFQRFLSPYKPDLSTYSRFNVALGATTNEAATANITFYDLNYSWGMYYHIKPLGRLYLMAGGLLDTDMGIKIKSDNVNNPYSFDFSTNLNFSGIARYYIITRKRTIRLQLAVQTPVMGCMFVPRNGESYYEILQLGNYDNTFHFSSFHNRLGLTRTFSIDLPLRFTTWHFGISYNTLRYKANDMVYTKDESGIVIGYTYDFYKFSGRKHKAPKNFISAGYL